MLRPGDRLVFNVWDEIGANDFANVVHQSLAASQPTPPPRLLAQRFGSGAIEGRIRAHVTTASG